MDDDAVLSFEGLHRVKSQVFLLLTVWLTQSIYNIKIDFLSSEGKIDLQYLIYKNLLVGTLKYSCD